MTPPPKQIHMGNMKHAVPLFLAADTIQHLDWLAKQLSFQRKTDVSRSEAVEYLVLRQWVKLQKQIAEKRLAKKPEILRA